MTEDESWDVHLLVLMLHHRDSFTIIPDRNGVGLTDGDRLKGRLSYRGHTHNLKYTWCEGAGFEGSQYCFY